MAAILRSGRSFKPELVLEVEYNTNIGHALPYILSFCSTFWLRNWQSYDNFKIWPMFYISWPSYLSFDQKHLQIDVTYEATYVD